MSGADLSGIKSPSVENLFRVEHFTDPTIGCVLEVFTPVKLLSLVAEAADDGARRARFFSTLTLRVGVQQIPWRFEIEAETLREAIDKFGAAAAEAGKKAIEEIESQQRKAILLGAGTGGGRPQ